MKITNVCLDCESVIQMSLRNLSIIRCRPSRASQPIDFASQNERHGGNRKCGRVVFPRLLIWRFLAGSELSHARQLLTASMVQNYKPEESM